MERIFWAGFIQILEVYTDSPLFAFFLYFYSIGQPLKVKNFIDSSCSFKLHHLISNGVNVFLRRALSWLLLGSNGWVNI